MGWTSRLKSSREPGWAVRNELRLTANPIKTANMIAAATAHTTGRVVFELSRRIGFAMNTGRRDTLRRLPFPRSERDQLELVPVPECLFFYEHCQYRSTARSYESRRRRKAARPQSLIDRSWPVKAWPGLVRLYSVPAEHHTRIGASWEVRLAAKSLREIAAGLRRPDTGRICHLMTQP